MVWTTELKATMNDWATRISRRSTQHILAARRYGFYGDMLMYGSISLGLGSGFVDFMNNKCAFAVKSVAGSLSIVSAILMAIVKFSNLLGMSEKHRASASEYSVLFRKIQLQLATAAELREDDTKFVANIIKEFQTIQSAAPLIPESVETLEERLFRHRQKLPPAVYMAAPAQYPGTTQETPKVDEGSSSPGAATRETLAGTLKRARQDMQRTFPNAPRGSLDLTKYPRYIHDNPTAVPMFTSEDPGDTGSSEEEDETDSA